MIKDEGKVKIFVAVTEVWRLLHLNIIISVSGSVLCDIFIIICNLKIIPNLGIPDRSNGRSLKTSGYHYRRH